MKRGTAIEITDQLTPAAAERFAQWIGCATVVYNQKTTENRDAYSAWCAVGKPDGERPRPNQIASHLAKRDGLSFLVDIPTEIKRNAASKWFEALRAALLGLRAPPRIKPKHKHKHKKRNCCVTSELFLTYNSWRARFLPALEGRSFFAQTL
ncbi:MAG: hypothetical protein ACR2QC_01600 [Gammaproteobacteria bacterium]